MASAEQFTLAFLVADVDERAPLGWKRPCTRWKADGSHPGMCSRDGGCNAAENRRLAREARFYPLFSWASLPASILAVTATFSV